MSTTAATILLVDDEESIQKLLTYPLERDGYRVVQARDGEEALGRFDEEPFDLVVLDVMLPKLDGLEVCKQLRASSIVPIIMLTARDDEVDKVLGSTRRRRLHHQAVLDPRVPQPGSGGAAAAATAAARARASPEPIVVDGLTIDPARAPSTSAAAGPAHLRRVRAPADARRQPGPGLHAAGVARVGLGRLDYRDPRTIDVHVRHLREKLERDPSDPGSS